MIRKLKLGASVAVMLLMVTTVVSCMDLHSKPDPQKITARFQAADTNHDGKLTLEEAKAGMPRVAKVFSQIDAENKGYVTLEQIQAFAANHSN
jgi:Ca2+-binding EF-hand superfamily protein